MKQKTSVKPSASNVARTDNFLMFPSDIVPDDPEEEQRWIRQYSDALFRYGGLCLNDKDIRNYQFAQGHVPEEEFSEVMKLYADPKHPDRVLPCRIPQVNAIARSINDVLGTIEQQSVDFNVAVVNEDAITEKLEHLVDEQTEMLTRFARQQAGTTELLGRPLKEGDDLMPVDPKQIENLNMQTFQQQNEENVSKALKYLMEKKSSALKWKLTHKAAYNYIVTQKIAFDTTIGLSDPEAEALDSRLLVYELQSNSPFIQKGRFSGYYFGITPQEVLDRCPNIDEASLKWVDEINKRLVAGTVDWASDKVGTQFGPKDYWYKDKVFSNFYFTGMQQYWRGLKKKLVKVSPNAYDEDNPHVHFVSDAEHKEWIKKEKQLKAEGKPTNDDVTFEYRYYNVWYECKRIGYKVYYQGRMMPNQLIDDDEPSEQDGPIVGIVDDIPCIVDLLVPLERMRIEALRAINLLMNQPMGNILVVDESLEEDGQENLYNMMAFKVYKYNGNKEGENFVPGTTKKAPTSVDMGMSQAVTDLMRLVGFIDQNMLYITGSNEPFLGNVKSDQGLGVTQLANQSAQRALQPYYSVYYTVVEMLLQRLTDLMRPAWAGKTVTKYWMGDKMAEFFSLSPDTDWHESKYGVFIQNSVKSNGNRQMMVQMAQQLLPIAKDPELALAVIEMFDSSSAAEAKRIFKNGVEAMRKIREEDMKMQQQQLGVQQQQLQVQEKVAQASDQAKKDTIIQKTAMEQEGETERKKMEITHKEDAMTVEFQNRMAELAAGKVLETQETE